MGPQNILHMPLLERYSPEKKTNHQNNPSKVQMELTPAKHRRDPSRKSHYPACKSDPGSAASQMGSAQMGSAPGLPAHEETIGPLLLAHVSSKRIFCWQKIKIKIKIPSVIPCIMQGSQVNVDKKRIV